MPLKLFLAAILKFFFLTFPFVGTTGAPSGSGASFGAASVSEKSFFPLLFTPKKKFH